MVTTNPGAASSNSASSGKHIIPEDKTDEVKALIARYVLLKIEQKKIEAKLSEIAKYYAFRIWQSVPSLRFRIHGEFATQEFGRNNQ